MSAPTAASARLVTLHYRIVLDNGEVALSTFDGPPATLQLGAGELFPALEQQLSTLERGAHAHLAFAPGEAFGPHHPERIEVVPRSVFADQLPAVDQVVELDGPQRVRLSGRVLAVADDGVTVDFNHPLAGRGVTFEVRILDVM